jgi:hypothetical protein
MFLPYVTDVYNVTVTWSCLRYYILCLVISSLFWMLGHNLIYRWFIPNHAVFCLKQVFTDCWVSYHVGLSMVDPQSAAVKYDDEIND